eukprot:392828_1
MLNLLLLLLILNIMQTKRNKKRHVSHDGSVREYNFETHEWTIINEGNNNNDEQKMSSKKPLAILGRQFNLLEYFPYLYNKQIMNIKTLSKYNSKFTINGNPLYIGNMINNELKDKIRTSDKQQHGDTGNTLWDTSILFAKVLEYNTFMSKDNNNKISKLLNMSNKNILELGTGLGFVGLCSVYCNARNVWLTDLKYCINNIQINVNKNKYIYNVYHNNNEECDINQQKDDNKIDNPFDNVSVFALDWLNPRQSLLEYNQIKNNNIDVIIGSDIIWLKELVPMLVNTLDYLYENVLNKENGIIIIGEQIRSNIVSELFWDLIKGKGFSKEMVSNKLYHPNFQSDTILLSLISK